MENTVKFISTTQAKYDALVSKDAGSLYFTSDTHRIYKGSELFSISDVTNLATKSDATLTERGYSEWTITRDGVDVTSQVSQQPSFDENVGAWFISDSFVQGDEPSLPYVGGEEDATSLTWYSSNNNQYVATRTAMQGYQLGDQ